MNKFLGIVVVLLFGAIAVIDLFHPGFAVTHDGQDHIARIANFYMNLQQGVFIPRWAANLNWGYGHPILEFLYPLPSYVASFFHFFGPSLIDSTKLVYALAIIASGATMYVFIKKLWGNQAGVVSGIFYMYAPYRFVDLYVRGDIGEHTAFVFVPLVFLGLYLLSQKQKLNNLLFTGISLALLILSHNAIALMVMPLIILYGMYLAWMARWNKKILFFFSTGIVIGFLLSGFFWIPALFEGQFTLRNIVTKGGYITSFVTVPQLIYGKWSYGGTGLFTVQLGILHWIFSILSVFFAFTLRKKDTKTAILILGSIAAMCAAIFLMLPVSNFLWQRIMLLQNFQFPWRFLVIPVIITSVCAGFSISRVSMRYRNILAIIVCVILLFLSKDYMHAKAYAQKPEEFFTGIYDSTTDTGESAPIWSVRFMGQRFDQPMDVIQGNAQITEEKRLTTMHTYVVSSQGTSRLLENTLYFPGWRVLVDGVPVMVQFQDPQFRGLMTFFVPDGTHTVSVSYHESKLRLFGDAISLMGIIGVILFFVLKKYKIII